MSDEKPPMPDMPEMPPMPPMEAPPAPPGMPEMPPMPPMEAPPAPPGMPEMPPMPPMEAPPAPPGMPEMPPMPPMEAPPAPPEMPPMDAPPAPPGMPPMDAPPAPPGMPPMDAPPAPPEMPSMDAPPEMPPMDAPPAPPEMPPMDAPPAPPGMPEMPPMDAPPEMPPMPPMDAPPEMPEMPPMPDATDDLLAPAPPADDLLAPAPPVETESVGGELAGATIRSSAEVDEVVGDKLVGTIHEIEKSTLNADGEIIKQSVKGTLTIANPSKDDRIYDIDVILDSADATDIGGDQVSVDELEAGKNYSMKYKVDGKRMLVLRERLDTHPARTEKRTLSVSTGEQGGPLALELEVENVSSVSLRDVQVTRPLPKEISFADSGESTIEDNVITWDVGVLAPGETKLLSIEGTIIVSNTKTIKAGSASASYGADSTLSCLAFKELDAFCRGFTYMRVREDERPDNWICNAIFENRSSFAVDLVKLQVRMKGSEELLFDISDVPDDVLPNGKWESEERAVMAQSEPDFTYDLSYTVLPRATSTTEGSITLEEKKFNVLEAEVEKTYSTSGLRSYRSQNINASLKLTNSGSSDINLLRLTDDIPGLFSAPDISALRVKVNGTEMSDEQYKAEISAGITLEKEHRSPDGDGHTLTMTIGTSAPVGLKPGNSITIEYDLNAPDPTPHNTRVDAPATIEFGAEVHGPTCNRDVAQPPSIKVIHHRRNFAAGKQAIPLGGNGRYEVLILFENNGDTALQDVYINDVLPSNFEVKDWHVRGAGANKRDDVEMTTDSQDDGTHITWHIPIVEKGERLDVSFEILGTGEIDAEALNRFHGAHFGDEVETEDVADLDQPEEEVAEEEAAEFPDMNWREDVLLRVMKAHDIEDRDGFLAHAMAFDSDDNGYLKKAELENAAKAWSPAEEVAEEVVEEVAEEVVEEEATETEMPAEEEVAEEVVEETTEESDGDKSCPICSTENASDSSACSACGFTFE
ncbi:MAG: hypothetical protein OSB30_05360 [Candidatus Poseidoniaceae archaeon]|nr:hypothetical protein [Candidatus Poseidoniaceae archaeon]